MNDIVGAPIPVIIKGRVFQFSPLNDIEASSLDAWILWANDNKISSEILMTRKGAAQVLYYSVKRTDNLPLEQCFDFLETDECISEVIEAYIELNKLPEVDIAGDKQPVDKSVTYDDVYLELSKRYGWTPQQISLLTSYQQLAYLGAIPKQVLRFETGEEYEEWLAKNVHRRE